MGADRRQEALSVGNGFTYILIFLIKIIIYFNKFYYFIIFYIFIKFYT